MVEVLCGLRKEGGRGSVCGGERGREDCWM